MQLSTIRTRTDVTLLQCVQIWLHIYWVPEAPLPRLNWMVIEGRKISVNVMWVL